MSTEKDFDYEARYVVRSKDGSVTPLTKWQSVSKLVYYKLQGVEKRITPRGADSRSSLWETEGEPVE